MICLSTCTCAVTCCPVLLCASLYKFILKCYLRLLLNPSPLLPSPSGYFRPLIHQQMTSRSISNEQGQNYKKRSMYKFTSKILKNFPCFVEKEFLILNSVRSSLQPVSKTFACWKSGQPIQCTNTCLASTAACALDISAPSLIDLHALSRVANTSACALHICSKWLVQRRLQKVCLRRKRPVVEGGLPRLSRHPGKLKAGQTSNGPAGKSSASQPNPATRRQ